MKQCDAKYLAVIYCSWETLHARAGPNLCKLLGLIPTNLRKVKEMDSVAIANENEANCNIEIKQFLSHRDA